MSRALLLYHTAVPGITPGSGTLVRSYHVPFEKDVGFIPGIRSTATATLTPSKRYVFFLYDAAPIPHLGIIS